MRITRGILGLIAKHSPPHSGFKDNEKVDKPAIVVDHKKPSSISSKGGGIEKRWGASVRQEGVSDRRIPVYD